MQPLFLNLKGVWGWLSVVGGLLFCGGGEIFFLPKFFQSQSGDIVTSNFLSTTAHESKKYALYINNNNSNNSKNKNNNNNNTSVTSTITENNNNTTTIIIIRGHYIHISVSLLLYIKEAHNRHLSGHHITPFQLKALLGGNWYFFHQLQTKV